jgi:hypothetical protein
MSSLSNFSCSPFPWSRSDRRARRGRSCAAALLAAGAALALLGWPDGAGAVEVNTGLVSIAPAQVAQLNVGGISNPNQLPNPAAGACQVRLTLPAARCVKGEACGFQDPEEFQISNPELLPGEAVFLRVPAEEIGLSGRGSGRSSAARSRRSAARCARPRRSRSRSRSMTPRPAAPRSCSAPPTELPAHAAAEASRSAAAFRNLRRRQRCQRRCVDDRSAIWSTRHGRAKATARLRCDVAGCHQRPWPGRHPTPFKVVARTAWPRCGAPAPCIWAGLPPSTP